MGNVIIQYVRNGKIIGKTRKNGKKREKTGVLVGLQNEFTKTISVGWSMYNKSQEIVPFNEPLGINIALGRAREHSKVLITLDDYINRKELGLNGKNCSFIPNSISNDVKAFVKRCEKYFKECTVTNVLIRNE